MDTTNIDEKLDALEWANYQAEEAFYNAPDGSAQENLCLIRWNALMELREYLREVKASQEK